MDNAIVLLGVSIKSNNFCSWSSSKFSTSWDDNLIFIWVIQSKKRTIFTKCDWGHWCHTEGLLISDAYLTSLFQCEQVAMMGFRIWLRMDGLKLSQLLITWPDLNGRYVASYTLHKNKRSSLSHESLLVGSSWIGLSPIPTSEVGRGDICTAYRLTRLPLHHLFQTSMYSILSVLSKKKGTDMQLRYQYTMWLLLQWSTKWLCIYCAFL